MMGHFMYRLFEGTLHVDKIHVQFKIANITHALPVPVHLKTDFTLKQVVVSRLHDTGAKFLTKVKFSLRYNNRGVLTPGWLAPAWHLVVVLCKKNIEPWEGTSVCKNPLKGTREVGGALSSFLPFYFRVRAFSIDLFTDTAAILNYILIRFKEYYRMPRGHEHISFVFSSAFRDIFS